MNSDKRQAIEFRTGFSIAKQAGKRLSSNWTSSATLLSRVTRASSRRARHIRTDNFIERTAITLRRDFMA